MATTPLGPSTSARSKKRQRICPKCGATKGEPCFSTKYLVYKRTILTDHKER